MTWDKGMSYDEIVKRVSQVGKDIKFNRCPENIGRRKIARAIHYFLAMIQLRNGCRISEASRSFIAWLDNGDRKLKVKLSKKRRYEERMIIIPFTRVAPCWRTLFKGYLASFKIDDEEALAKELSRKSKIFWSKEGVNTHNIRYAFVTYLSKKGYPPQVIAKVIGLSKYDIIVTYTQKHYANELLELDELFREVSKT